LIVVKRAFFSVADKAGLVELAQGLDQLGVELIATGETGLVLRGAGLPVEVVASLSAAISAVRRGEVQLAVVNLAALSGERASLHEPLLRPEDLDTLTLLIAGASDRRSAATLADPRDYSAILEELRARGALSPETADRLAERAFNSVVYHAAAIAKHLASEPLPVQLNLAYPRVLGFREANAPLVAALYSEHAEAKLPRQLHGPPLSDELMIEVDIALRIPHSFDRPTAVIVKHGEPRGLASAEAIEEAFARAYAADERAAEWALAGLNRPVTVEGANLLARHSVDGVLAPAYERGALEILKKRKGFHVLEGGEEILEGTPRLELRQTIFGLLARAREAGQPRTAELKVASRRVPTARERADGLFASKALPWLRREAVLLVSEECVVGLGAGQPSLLDAAELAIFKAAERARGSVLASATALPSRELVDLAAAARVGLVIAPEGRASGEVVAAADEQGLALAFTGPLILR
jgi:phosphoribosylaminoimidazolecarboxamide formyltransferase/IMP cyclohydrolase